MQMITTMALLDAAVTYKLFFNIDMPQWTIYFRYVFQLFPSFHFTKLYSDVTRVTSSHLSFEGMLWVPGRKWEYSDLFRTTHGQFMTKDRYVIPPMYDTCVQILWVSLGYLTFAIYFDNIFAENRGQAKGYLFFLSPSYWLSLIGIKTNSRVYQKRGVDKAVPNEHQTAVEERKHVLNEELITQACQGVRIVGLGKTYQPKNVQALKGVYLEVSEGELLGIMGHNGAGKTTLINLLSGFVQLTQGTARIFGLSIEQDLEHIRRNMGIVSQFDVLWDELTALDHMLLFSLIKRVHYPNMEQFFIRRLKEVGLLDSANLQVGKYSGGMRRRMSVALSTIGDPNVILMDEPTTGMDPVSRRQVWDLIQQMKKGRVLIMTTHAMEEAELLSDKLAVLNQGEVRCVGTPLQLKNLLGKGYRVSMVCEKQEVERVKVLFKRVVPSAEFYESSGDSGSLVYNVPLDKVRELSNVFKLIDTQNQRGVTPDDEAEKTFSLEDRQALQSLKSLVSDVGVSQTTLEEVFMAATTH